MNRVWNLGKPPKEGWYNASQFKHRDLWRYWNGQWWSAPADVHYSKEEAELTAKNIAMEPHTRIYWSDYMPDGGVFTV